MLRWIVNCGHSLLSRMPQLRVSPGIQPHNVCLPVERQSCLFTREHQTRDI
jgi:hypothetical protein